MSCSFGAKGRNVVRTRSNNYKENDRLQMKTSGSNINIKEIISSIDKSNLNNDVTVNTDIVESTENVNNEEREVVTVNKKDDNNAVVVIPSAYISTVNDVSINNVIVIGTADGNIHGIRKDTMEIMWTSTTGRPMLSAHKVSKQLICKYFI
jgi:hypothetical protein